MSLSATPTTSNTAQWHTQSHEGIFKICLSSFSKLSMLTTSCRSMPSKKMLAPITAHDNCTKHHMKSLALVEDEQSIRYAADRRLSAVSSSRMSSKKVGGKLERHVHDTYTRHENTYTNQFMMGSKKMTNTPMTFVDRHFLYLDFCHCCRCCCQSQ